MSLDKKLKSEYQKGWESGYEKGMDAAYDEIEKNINANQKSIEEYIKISNYKFNFVRKIIRTYFDKKCGRYIGMCPFHKEENPSCVYEGFEDEFYCLFCGESGDGLKLARALDGEKSKMCSHGYNIDNTKPSEEQKI